MTDVLLWNINSLYIQLSVQNQGSDRLLWVNLRHVLLVLALPLDPPCLQFSWRNWGPSSYLWKGRGLGKGIHGLQVPSEQWAAG